MLQESLKESHARAGGGCTAGGEQHGALEDDDRIEEAMVALGDDRKAKGDFERRRRRMELEEIAERERERSEHQKGALGRRVREAVDGFLAKHVDGQELTWEGMLHEAKEGG